MRAERAATMSTEHKSKNTRDAHMDTHSPVTGDTMTSYRFVEQIDDRLRADLMELYRHEWWTNQRRDEDVTRMLQHTDLVVGVPAPILAASWSASPEC